MRNKKRLPVHHNPAFSTECYHQYRLSIVMADPRKIGWVHSHFINLKLLPPPVTEGFPMIRLEEHLDIYKEILEEFPLVKSVDWVRTIRKAISNQHYVVLYLNWRYIQASKYYGHAANLVHEALIYGFDDEQQAFEMLAFDVEGKVYGATKISYQDCERELQRVLDTEMNAQRWFAFYGFPIVGIRPRDMKESGPDMHSIYFALDRGAVHSRDKAGNTFAVGFPVSLALSEYFESQCERGGTIPESEFAFWNVMVYKMIQHNAAMNRRLDFLGNMDPIFAERIKGFYEKTKKGLAVIRSSSLQYQRSRDPALLHEISGLFAQNYEAERRAHPLMKEALVFHHLKKYS